MVGVLGGPGGTKGKLLARSSSEEGSRSQRPSKTFKNQKSQSLFLTFGRFLDGYWLREPSSELDLAESLILVPLGPPETPTIASYVHL